MATVLDRWVDVSEDDGRVNLIEFAPGRYRTFGVDAVSVSRVLNRPRYTTEGFSAVDINAEPEGWEDILSRAGLNVIKHQMEEVTV